MKCKRDFVVFKRWSGNLRQISSLERWKEFVFKIVKGIPIEEFSSSEPNFEEYKRQRKFLETGNVIQLVSVERIEMVQFISENDIYVSVPFNFPLNYSLSQDSKAVFSLKDLKNVLPLEGEGFKKIHLKITNHPFCVLLEDETKFDIVRNFFNTYEEISGQDSHLNDVLSKPLYFNKFYFEDYFLCSNVSIDSKSSILELFYIPAYYPIQLETSLVYFQNYACQVNEEVKCQNPFLFEFSLLPCNQYEPIEIAKLETNQKVSSKKENNELKINAQQNEETKKSEICSSKKKRPSVKRRKAFNSSKKTDRLSQMKNFYDKKCENHESIINKNENIVATDHEILDKATKTILNFEKSSKSTSNLNDFIEYKEANSHKLDYVRKLSMDHFLNPLYFEEKYTGNMSNESSSYHSVESLTEPLSVGKVETLQAPQNRPLPPIPPTNENKFILGFSEKSNSKIQTKKFPFLKNKLSDPVYDSDVKPKDQYEVQYENLPIPQKRTIDKKGNGFKNNKNQNNSNSSFQTFLEDEKKEGQAKKYTIKKKLLTTRVSTSDVYKYKKRSENTDTKPENEKTSDQNCSTLPKHTSTRSNSIVASLHTIPRKLRFWRNSSKNLDESKPSKLQIFQDEQPSNETFNDEKSFELIDNNEFEEISEKIKDKSTTKKLQRIKTVDSYHQTRHNFNGSSNRISKSNDSNEGRYDTIEAEAKNMRKYSRSLDDFSGFISSEYKNNDDDCSCYEMIVDNKMPTPEVFTVSSPPLLIIRSKVKKSSPELADEDLDDDLYNSSSHLLHETSEKSDNTGENLSDVYLVMQSSEYLHPDNETSNAIPKNKDVLLKNDNTENCVENEGSDEEGEKTAKDTWFTVQDIPLNVHDFNVEEVVKSLELLGMGTYGCEFKEKQVDGSLLLSLDVDVLMEEFDFKKFDAIKLIKFSRDGWRPKINKKSN